MPVVLAVQDQTVKLQKTDLAESVFLCLLPPLYRMPSMCFLIEEGFPINSTFKGYGQKVTTFRFDRVLNACHSS